MSGLASCFFAPGGGGHNTQRLLCVERGRKGRGRVESLFAGGRFPRRLRGCWVVASARPLPPAPKHTHHTSRTCAARCTMVVARSLAAVAAAAACRPAFARSAAATDSAVRLCLAGRLAAASGISGGSSGTHRERLSRGARSASGGARPGCRSARSASKEGDRKSRAGSAGAAGGGSMMAATCAGWLWL